MSSSVKPRHVTMISLGGTIGAGLFIGIAEPLTQAGPLGTILAYFAAGLVMLGTMMCLGELATSFPHSGSFQYYAYKFFPSPLLSYPKSRSKPSRYSSENDVLIEKSLKYTDFFLLSIVYV